MSLGFPRRFTPAKGPPRPGARQRALAELHGVDLVPLERMRAHAACPVGQFVPDLLKSIRLEQRQGEAEIVRVWNQLMDPTLVAHAQPTGLHQGTLFVRVDSSPWLDEIVRYRRKEILTRLQHSFGRELIQRISFRVG